MRGKSAIRFKPNHRSHPPCLTRPIQFESFTPNLGTGTRLPIGAGSMNDHDLVIIALQKTPLPKLFLSSVYTLSKFTKSVPELSMIERQLRLWTGLVLSVFIALHLANHSLGLISIDAMETMRRHIMPIWQSVPGTVVLYGARLSHELLNIDLSYDYVVTIQWTTLRYLIQQPILVLIAWLHVVIGLHYWLRIKPWYPQAIPFLYALALLLPVMALLGFVRTGLTMEDLISDPFVANALYERWWNADEEHKNLILTLEPIVLKGMGLVLLAVLVARSIKLALRRRDRSFQITHSNGKTLLGTRGQSILETIREAGIAHASVCGGRGRCTTCRVRVGTGFDALAPPSALEAAALARIEADPNVRLACQTRPLMDVDITPLLAPKATPEDSYKPGGVSGREQEVAVMFIDLRGSTGLGEQRLPYDVVFILNQFFSEMSDALESTGGHYAQFTGDGLMALYGLESGMKDGARHAINGAIEMCARMDSLNGRLKDELTLPLEIGIGIHCGEAIVGTMGPPKFPNFSAIGDNINIAARLEAQTKVYECALVISAEAAHAADIDLSRYPIHTSAIRGREEPVMIYAVHNPQEINEI